MKWKENDPRYKNRGRLCDIPGCNKRFYAKGLCQNHYESKRRNSFLACKVSFFGQCIVDGCEKEAKGNHGFCSTHYSRQRKGKDLNKPIGNSGPLNHKWKGGVSEYPNHYKVKKARIQVLIEEKHRCFNCGKWANQIHHLDGTKTNHDRSNLRACCHSCNIRFAGSHTSKYVKMYGLKQFQIARKFNKNSAWVSQMHKQGKLNSLLIADHIREILF